MKAETVELYTDEDMDGMGRWIKTWSLIMFAVGAAALAACIAMAALTTTGNAERMELAAVVTSTVCGWFVIYCAYFAVGSTRREFAHAVMLRTEERQRLEGEVIVTKNRISIRKSITARRVEVRTENGTVRMLVTERRAAKLMEARAVAVYSAHGYVAAYETDARL